MKRNYINDGVLNEYDFVKYLNGKYFISLDDKFKKLIIDLFGAVNDYDIIYCYKNNYEQKSDIFISINYIVKGISIKSGYKNSVHVERISDFINFLIVNNVDRKVILEYLKYQYGDGTTNGSGNNRISVKEYKERYQKNIDFINDNINNFCILEKAIDRFILKGRNSDTKIDGIIYGNIYDFLFISSDDVKNIILNRISDYSTGVHLGCLSIQPLSRCLNYNKEYEYARFLVQVKWYNILEDYKEYYSRKELYEYNR